MESVYDKALAEIGDSGPFQTKFDLIYNIALPIFWSMAYSNIILVLAVIPYTCEFPEKPENVSDLSWKMKYIPSVPEDNGRIKFDSCSIYVDIDRSNVTKGCDSYKYDKTWYDSTVPSDNNWVCSKELYVANVFAYNRIAEIIGSMFFGWFGDVYGRRISYIMSLALIVLGRVILLLCSHSFYVFLIGSGITCLSSWNVVQCTIVISLEISSPSRRATTMKIRNSSLTVAMCIMPFLYWWLRDWKMFMIVTTLSQIPFLLLCWSIIESPRWLWVRGKTDLCIKYLKQIAKGNKTDLAKTTEEEILLSPSVDKTQTLGILALFSGWRLAITTILQLVIAICITMSYTMLLMGSLEKTDGNPFVAFACQAAAELPGYFIGAWLADRIGRCRTSAGSLGITALIWTLTAYGEYSTSEWVHNYWTGTILAILGRLAITIAYYTINLFNMELYPTCLRQSGMSLGNVLSSVGSAIAPYILYLGRRIDSRLPGIILTGVTTIGLISSLLLPETLNAKLPETLEDAQEFGKGYTLLLGHSNKNNINKNNKVDVNKVP